MRLAHGRHLAFCPELPRSGSWAETFASLHGHVLAVRDGVRRAGEWFGIGLRLGDQAARELQTPRAFTRFRRWLLDERCEVLTLNDSSAGAGIGAPDWTDPERLAHACRLLDLLGDLLPAGLAGTLSTTLGLCHGPGRRQPDAAVCQAVYAHFIHAAAHAAEVSGRTGRRLSLALEMGGPSLAEDMVGTIRFLEPLVEAFPDQFGVCFDTARCAVGFEEATRALAALDRAEVPVLKMRLGTALATPVAVGEERRGYGSMPSDHSGGNPHDPAGEELSDVLDWLVADRSRCPLLEMGILKEGVADPFAHGCQRALGLLTARGLA